MGDTMEGHVRFARVEDAGQVLAIYVPYVRDTAITFEWEVPEAEEMEARIARTLTRFPWLVYEQDGRIVGYAYASPFHDRAAYSWAAETSIYVERGRRRSGIGRTLYRDLEVLLAHMGIINLNACIGYVEGEDPYLTQDSVRFHERLGYARVAHFHQCGYKFGRWYDMIWMEKAIGEHTATPTPVMPIEEARIWYETAWQG